MNNIDLSMMVRQTKEKLCFLYILLAAFVNIIKLIHFLESCLVTLSFHCI